MVQNRKQALPFPPSINVEPGKTLVHAAVYRGWHNIVKEGEGGGGGAKGERQGYRERLKDILV